MNSSRVYLERFVRRCAQGVREGDRMLDAGAGSAPYRALFPSSSYESVDHEQTPGKTYGDTDYVADLTELPMADGRYDVVLLNQVLEHLPEPVAALRELHRVLKPGGQIWATQPLFYEEHDLPHDYFRYTQGGLLHVFGSAGFKEVEIEWLEGYLGTLSYQASVLARALPRGRRVASFASEALARWDLRRKVTSVGHPKNYAVVARA